MTKKIKPAARKGRQAVASGLLCAIALLAVVGVAGAKHDEDGWKPTKYKVRGLIVRMNDTTVTVCVGTQKKSTNKRAVAWRGRPVILDLASAKLKVKDINHDRHKNIGDVVIGDRVKMDVKLPRDLSLAESPYHKAKIKIENKKKKIKIKDGYWGGVCPETPDEGWGGIGT
jgi:hypothetical protein